MLEARDSPFRLKKKRVSAGTNFPPKPSFCRIRSHHDQDGRCSFHFLPCLMASRMFCKVPMTAMASTPKIDNRMIQSVIVMILFPFPAGR